MTEATETTAQERAAEAAGWFESAQRVAGDEETEYVRLKDGRPEWVQDLAREAHGDMFPDDFRYAAISYALDYIAENGDGEECYAEEFADQNVDVYTGQLLAWLSSNLQRVGYCDEAAEEFGPSDKNIIERITLGQYWELLEVFGLVRNALNDA